MEQDGLKNMKVKKDGELKEFLVNYVGNKLNPESENITIEMIVSVIADEFPDFLLVVAEENFIRGYEQALDDVSSVKNEKIHTKQQ